jgi:phosphoribosylformimino-5-aminoimidazole carboxamide ribotide isomerase
VAVVPSRALDSPLAFGPLLGHNDATSFAAIRTMLIYPAIDLLNGRCVRLRQGDYSRETVFSVDSVAVARQWVDQGATRLHIVDLDGARGGKPINGPVIRQIVEASGVPCQLGGGIRTDADLAAVFNWGVQWAVLGTRALQDPAWVAAVAERYPQRIVLGVDAKKGFVATEGWLEVSQVKAIDLANRVQDSPLAAVVYTDIAKDGMMSGPNFEALAEMQSAVKLPLIASGGVSTLDHVKRLTEMKVYGCIIGRALYEGAIDLRAACGMAT